MNTAALIAAVAVVGSAAPQAAPQRPAAPPAVTDQARLAAANALVQQLGLKAQLERQTAQTVQLMKQGVVIRSMLAQQPGFIPAYQANRARFDAALQKAGAIQAEVAQKVIAQNMNAVVAAAAQAYARQFTAAELNGLLAFYKSPLGQAVNARQPAVASEIGQANARLIGARIDAAIQANASRLQAALAPLNGPPPAPAKK
jgi:hypothetical protein